MSSKTPTGRWALLVIALDSVYFCFRQKKERKWAKNKN